MLYQIPPTITFTGVDQYTKIEDLKQLSSEYMIEFGILFSSNRQGIDTRYPSLEYIKSITSHKSGSLCFAAHICGNHARAIASNGTCSITPFLKDCGFKIIQVNTSIKNCVDNVSKWAIENDFQCILQCRESSFPTDTRVFWLYDKSGGKGIVPQDWPPLPANGICGYAGGITHENVVEVLKSVSATMLPKSNFWIDMEAGVRTNDIFDIGKCRQVLEQVYSFTNRFADEELPTNE